MTQAFEGRHVVVTGGTGALGSAVTARLLEQGAHVHIPSYAAHELDGFAHRDHARCRIVEDVDLSDEAAVARAYGDIPELWASIHIAGGFTMAAIEDTPLADYQRMVAMNLTTCFLCCREAARRLTGAGRIVNVAARQALVPAGGSAAYAASKGAVATLTLSLAEELRERGIWVNAVVPSIIDTPANRRAMPGADHAAWPTVDEVAQTITFLASPTNAVTRGALVPVFGRS